MNRRSLLCCVVAVLLAGCQCLPMMASRETCKDKTCQLDVTVTGSPPRVRVSADVLTVSGNRDVAITWNLKTPEYEFRNDSIQFYDPRSTSQFSAPSAGERGGQVRLTNRNSEKGEWGYMIKVYERTTGKWIPLDPIIFNDGN